MLISPFRRVHPNSFPGKYIYFCCFLTGNISFPCDEWEIALRSRIPPFFELQTMPVLSQLERKNIRWRKTFEVLTILELQGKRSYNKRYSYKHTRASLIVAILWFARASLPRAVLASMSRSRIGTRAVSDLYSTSASYWTFGVHSPRSITSID